MDHKKTSHRFLITYGSSCPSITQQICNAICKKIEVDECYTLTQRDLKYTLLHVKQRTVRSTFTSLMCHWDEVFGIKGACVFGYPIVSLGSEVDEHPGMQLIAQNLNSGAACLDCWMAEGCIRDNKRGLLYAFLEGFSVDNMNKAQLFNQVKVLNSKLTEARALIAEMESSLLEIDQLRQENRRLKLRLETQLFVFAKSGRSHELPPPSP